MLPFLTRCLHSLPRVLHLLRWLPLRLHCAACCRFRRRAAVRRYQLPSRPPRGAATMARLSFPVAAATPLPALPLFLPRPLLSWLEASEFGTLPATRLPALLALLLPSLKLHSLRGTGVPLRPRRPGLRGALPTASRCLSRLPRSRRRSRPRPVGTEIHCKTTTIEEPNVKTMQLITIHDKVP